MSERPGGERAIQGRRSRRVTTTSDLSACDARAAKLRRAKLRRANLRRAKLRRDCLTMEGALRHFYHGRILALSPAAREHLAAGDRAGK
jgi:hypothetical protein